jgi:death-on-curing protein
VGWRYPDIADFLIIAGAVLTVDPIELARSDHLLALAESALGSPAASFEGHDFYPDFARKAAVLYSHLARNHPLPDGNKRTALLCMVEFIERNDYSLNSPTVDGPEMEAFEELLSNVASSAVSEEAFAEWIAGRLMKASRQNAPPKDQGR